MARILLGDEWFEELATTSLYESEFENILFQSAYARELSVGYLPD